jgi:hypothetical protein
MEIYLLRKGSSGLSGSFENANHHAKPCVPLIHAALAVIEQLSPNIEKWGQGKNVHVIHAKDGRKVVFRPYRSKDSWGIELRIQVSRAVEVPIMTFDRLSKVKRLHYILRDFLRVKENFYGQAEDQA